MKYLTPSADCPICDGDGVDTETIKGKWLRCRCTLKEKWVTEENLPWALAEGWQIQGKTLHNLHVVYVITPRQPELLLPEPEPKKETVDVFPGRGIPPSSKPPPPTPKPDPPKKKRRKPKHRNLPKPKPPHFLPPERTEVDVDGFRIQGSNYFRGYCRRCNEPMRVENPSQQYLCEECNPGRQIIGTLNNNVIIADIQYHGQYADSFPRRNQ